jgi:hypothetical protein
VPFDEGGFAHPAVSDEDELELGHFLLGLYIVCEIGDVK